MPHWLVVQCFSCKAFQVDQEKKAKRWQCKLCHEKQSLQRVFARSHRAADCRQVVMQYNSARGAIEAEETERALEAAYAEAEGGEGGWEEGQQPGGHGAGDGWLEDGRPQHAHQAAQQGQRWLEFAEDDEDDDGPTLAVPEQAPKQKRSGGRGGGGASDGRSGGGGKRQRQEQEQQEPSGWVEVPQWGEPACDNAAAGWQGTHQQHQHQQQPLCHMNGPAGRAPPSIAARRPKTWQQQQQQPWQQQQRPQPTAPQHQLHSRQQAAPQPQRQWQAHGSGSTHSGTGTCNTAAAAPVAQSWGQWAGSADAVRPPAQAASGGGRWASFAAEDDW